MKRVYVVGMVRDALIDRIKKGYPGLQVVNDRFLVDGDVGKADCDVVICYGGDGTLLYGEEHIPEVPKMMLRNTMLCDSCVARTERDMLAALADDQYTIQEYDKLEARGARTHTALYDVMIGHARVNMSVRLRFAVNGKPHVEEVVGDGIVISTALGSTGYYQSITRSNFSGGIGIAFNNSVNTMSNVVVDADSVIDVDITRGPAVLATDNTEDTEIVETGNAIQIRRSQHTGKLLSFAGELEQYNFATHRFPAGICQLCQSHI